MTSALEAPAGIREEVKTPLPDLSRLSALPDSTWRTFRHRLQASGLDVQYLHSIWPGGLKIYERLQWALRVWNVRRRSDPATYAYRTFVLRDPVTDSEIETVLGRPLLETMLEAGLLVRPEPDRVVSAFDCRLFMGMLILCDDLAHGGDAVFGAGPGTDVFCGLSRSRGILNTALDVGCGAGGAALWLRTYARRVVATDINPRALDFVRINAAINAVNNVEPRLGSLFQPVAGEEFDLITAQPPFVPRNPHAGSATYRFGGPHGNELVLQILSEISRYLTREGRALMVLEQPVMADIDARGLREPQRDENLRALLIRGAEVDADAYSIRQAASELRRGLEPYDQTATAMRAHLEAMGIQGVSPAICIMERAPDGDGWLESIDAGDLLWGEASEGVIERLLTARTLLREADTAALRQRIRLPEASLLVQPVDARGRADERAYLGFGAGSLVSSLELTREEWCALQKHFAGEPTQLEPHLIARLLRAGLIDG